MKIALLTCAILLGAITVPAQVSSVCPRISVEGPTGVTPPGDTMTFKAVVDSALPSGLKFEWKVSIGPIEFGQGSSTIIVRVPLDFNGGTITAEVRLLGLPKNCLSSASETAGVIRKPEYDPPDSYRRIALIEEKARLQNAVVQTQNDPSWKLFIVKYSPTIGPAEKKRQNQLSSFLINVMKFPRSRFAFVYKTSATVETIIVIAPPGFTFDGMILR